MFVFAKDAMVDITVLVENTYVTIDITLLIHKIDIMIDIAVMV